MVKNCEVCQCNQCKAKNNFVCLWCVACCTGAHWNCTLGDKKTEEVNL